MSTKYALIAIVVVALAGWLLVNNADSTANRRKIATRLQELGKSVAANPNDEESLREIVRVLNSNWTFASQYACGTLRDLGPTARVGIPNLMYALEHREHVVRREAARAIGKVAIGDPRPLDLLVKKMRTDHVDVAAFSAEALGEIGIATPEVIRALEAATKVPSLSYEARESLAKLDPG